MRFFHLADLHIGKSMNNYNLREDQEAILHQIVVRAKERRPDAVLLAGDIFDRSVPAGEAYTILDTFLTELTGEVPGIHVYIIAGNHDSPLRLAYAADFMRRFGIVIKTMPPQTEDEFLHVETLEDAFGPVHFWFLPFTKPGFVRELLGEDGLSYDQSIAGVLARETVNTAERNVILSHQFVVGGSGDHVQMPQLSDSETVSGQVGGLDEVHAGVYDPFDYVALGHIHRPQTVGRDTVRYSGSMLKYSISEADLDKSITEINLGEKKNGVCSCEILSHPLVPLRDVSVLTGTLEEVLAKDDLYQDTYVCVKLTDETGIFQVRETLDAHFPYLLEYHLMAQEKKAGLLGDEDGGGTAKSSPLDVFVDFSRAMRQTDPRDEELLLMQEIIEKVTAEEDR